MFIDAETIPAELAGPALAEVSRFGDPLVKRAYADWSLPGSGDWSRELARHSITSMSSTEHSAGRHAVATALVIQALDMHNGGILDGFVILCDDDSFVDLAARLRAGGATVVGGGLEGVSSAFVEQCDTYLDLDALMATASLNRATLARAAMSRTA